VAAVVGDSEELVVQEVTVGGPQEGILVAGEILAEGDCFGAMWMSAIG